MVVVQVNVMNLFKNISTFSIAGFSAKVSNMEIDLYRDIIGISSAFTYLA